MYNPKLHWSTVNIEKEIVMRKNLCVALSVLSLGLLLTSGCAKDQVKPDEGIASKTSTAKASGQEQSAASQQSAAQQQSAQQQSSAQQQASAQQQSAASQQQAAERAAAEKAAAAKAAQQLADEKAAAEKAAAAKAAQQADMLKMINFEFDSYALSQQARDILYADAEYILKNYKGKLKLEGHCDERGSDEYNLALGENRAKAALNYLLTLGVPAGQLSIISYGKERPLDPASTEEAWAKNRRVEFKIVK
jgi:peptidoglycan-associated lipoprotein